MNVWDWVDEFESQARQRGDARRLRLVELHSLAYANRHTEPDRMLALCEEGLRLAQALGEPWWVLFYEDWRLETLIYYKLDYRRVIDLGVAATLQLGKPPFQQHPLRFAVWCNLVAAYLCVDPRGYARPVRSALDYLRSELPEEGEERYLYWAREHWFAYELGHFDRARELSLFVLALTDTDPARCLGRHHAVDTYSGLCRVLFRQQDWSALDEAAGAGEELAGCMGYRYELAQFLLWRALSERRAGREEEARRLCRRGTAQMGRLGMQPGDAYHDALAAYHELGGRPDAAWQVREREVGTIAGRGQLAGEADCRLKRCRLLRQMGKPLAAEAEALRRATALLKDPTWYLEELERIRN